MGSGSIRRPRADSGKCAMRPSVCAGRSSVAAGPRRSVSATRRLPAVHSRKGGGASSEAVTTAGPSLAVAALAGARTPWQSDNRTTRTPRMSLLCQAHESHRVLRGAACVRCIMALGLNTVRLRATRPRAAGVRASHAPAATRAALPHSHGFARRSLVFVPLRHEWAGRRYPSVPLAQPTLSRSPASPSAAPGALARSGWQCAHLSPRPSPPRA
jgi:hypothetical protein